MNTKTPRHRLCGSLKITWLFLICFSLAHGTSDFANWKMAKDTCQKRGYIGLPQGVNDNEVKKLLQQMEIKGVSLIWTRIKRVDFERKVWIDESTTENTVQETVQCRCSIVDSLSGEDFLGDCQVEVDGHICNFTSSGCVNCNYNPLCLQNKEECYTVFVKRGSWYDARTSCKDLGGDLIVLRKNVGHFLKDHLWKNQFHHKYAKFWVGARTADWVDSETNGTLLKYLWNGFWLDEQAQCVALTLRLVSQGEYGWVTLACDKKAHFICSTDPLLDKHRDTTSENGQILSSPRKNGVSRKVKTIIREGGKFGSQENRKPGMMVYISAFAKYLKFLTTVATAIALICGFIMIMTLYYCWISYLQGK